jgi:hypothetical protein
MAGWFVMVSGPAKESPRSGFSLLRYRVVPAEVHVEALEIGQATDLPSPGGLAAGQNPELVEVDRLGALPPQVGVEERRVTQLVVRVVGYVLRHVAVEVLQGGDVGCVAAVGSAQLVVLLPEVALDDLGRRQEAEDRDVAFAEHAVRRLDVGREQCGGRQRGAGHADAFEKGAPPDDVAPVGVEQLVR